MRESLFGGYRGGGSEPVGCGGSGGKSEQKGPWSLGERKGKCRGLREEGCFSPSISHVCAVAELAVLHTGEWSGH